MDIIEEFKQKSTQRFKDVKKQYPYHIKLLIYDNAIYLAKYYTPHEETIFGLTTLKEWYAFLDKLRERYNQAYKNMEKYLKKQKKPVYFHSSITPLTGFDENKTDFYFNDVYTFNPPGIWFSCDDQWFKYFKKYSSLNLKNEEIKLLDLRFAPFNIYRLCIDNLRVKNIKNCEELLEFTNKYKDKSVNRKYMLSLPKIKKDYDVIIMCDYLAIKCSDYIQKKNDFSWNDVMEDVFLSKMKQKDKKIIWAYRWETGTGVVIKDLNKIVYKKMKF